MPNDFMMFLLAGFVILVVMLIFFGGGIPLTDTYQIDYDLGISHNITGAVLVGPEDVNAVTPYDIDINTSYTRGKTTHETGGKELTNGLLFGGNSLKYQLQSTDVEGLDIEFEVARTNNYAPLTIKVNDKVAISRNFITGKHTVTVSDSLLADDMTIEFIAESSTWKIWAPTLYELADIKLIEDSFSYKPNEFNFFITNDEYHTFREARVDLTLDENLGDLILKVNDNPVYSDVVTDYQSIKFDKNDIRLGENVLHVRAGVNSKFEGIGRMIIFYKTEREHTLEMLFNLSEAEYEMFDKGKITFDIVEVVKGGGLSVKIIAGASEKLSEYGTVEENRYSYAFGKDNVRAGKNRVTIKSIDDAAFSVNNFEVKY